MSTRSSILIKVPDTFLNSTAQYNKEMFETKELLWPQETCPDKSQEILITKPYLGIYCHWDGYPNGVGKELISNYNDFSSAFNLILGGDCSVIIQGNIQRYATRKSEDWKYIQPRQLEEIKKVSDDSEYLYLFEGYRWFLVENGYKILLPDTVENLDDYISGYLAGVEDGEIFNTAIRQIQVN